MKNNFEQIIALLILCCLMSSCKDVRYKTIATARRKIYLAENAYFRMVTLDNSDCAFKCKNKLTYAAINDQNFSLALELDERFVFINRDSLVKQQYILKPGDSLVVACGCSDMPINSTDWNMNLTIVSAKKLTDN